MSIFQRKNSAAISDDTHNVYAMIKQKLGSEEIPEFFVVQNENSKTVFTGSINLISNIMLEGMLPRVLKEMIFYTISSSRKCVYCSTIHGDFCRNLGVNEAVLKSLTHDLESIEPIRTRIIIEFALKCAESPGELTPEDYSKVREAGVSDAELMEVLATSACTVYANIMADSLKVSCDE